MTKVLIVAMEIGATSGGKGRYSYEVMGELVPQLAAMGCEVTVLVPSDAPMAALAPHARIVRLPVPKNTSVWRAIWEEIYIPCYGWGTDAVVIMNGMVPAGPLLTKRKIAVFYDIHPLQHLEDPEHFPGAYSRKSLIRTAYEAKKAIRDAHRIVTISDSVTQELESFLHVPRSRMVMTPCGVDGQFFRPQPPDRIDELRRRYQLPEKFYLFIGTPHAEAGNKKNLHRIVEAYSHAPDGEEHLLPVVLAGGEWFGIRREPVRVPLGGPARRDHYLYLGFVPDGDFPALYSAAYALLFPSLHEGFGIPPLEAMACGTPVIAANRPAIPEVVGDAALMIDPLSTESLLDAIHKVNDPAVRQELIAKGFARARLYSWRRSAEILLPLILDETPKRGRGVLNDKVERR